LPAYYTSFNHHTWIALFINSFIHPYLQHQQLFDRYPILLDNTAELPVLRLGPTEILQLLFYRGFDITLMNLQNITTKGVLVALVSLLLIFPAAAHTYVVSQPSESIVGPPSVFDLRNVDGVNYVTSVRDQSGGTCWTHGVMAAIEGNLLMTNIWAATGMTVEPNLAEYHLDWWNGFNEHNNDDTIPKTGGGLTVHMGGDYRLTAAYLARGEGAVYCPAANDDTELDDNWYEEPPNREDDSYQYYYVPDIEWYVAGTNLERIDDIKNTIMTQGVVGTSLCSSSSFMQNNVHYQPPSSTRDPNHAVAIIGWNDSKETQAPQPGAWLVKNSWSSSWGEDGYFWISYYDKHCGQHPEMGIISFQDVQPLPYANFYYHDYHGWRDTLAGVQEALNAFTATEDELMTAVSFFTASDNTNYHAIIYDNFENGELEGELAESHGVINHTGLHTIPFESPVRLRGEDDFYIYLQLLGGGHPYDRTSEVPVLLGYQSPSVLVGSAAQPGESYYRENGQWLDLYNYAEIPYPGTANFCMKALTVPQEMQIDVTGGFGISVEIQNNGESDLTNVAWSIELEGLVLFQQNHGGTITLLPAGGTIHVDTGLLFGFGSADVRVQVDSTEKEYQMLLLGPIAIKQ